MLAACCSAVFTGTNRIVGRVTASQIASASATSVLFLDVRLHVGWRHHADRVAQRRDLACPVMCTRTGLHTYGEAAARALPHAVQVADRWHLMENASRAFLNAIRKSMRQIRSAIGATTINPKLLSAAERLQYEGYLRREETNATILALSKGGMPIKQIVRQIGHSRKLVRQVIRGERHDIFRTRQSSLDQHLPWLDDQWAAGCRNCAELWRRLKARGFRGSLRVVAEWATRRRRVEKADAQNLHRIPSARTIARLMTIGRPLDLRKSCGEHTAAVVEDRGSQQTSPPAALSSGSER